MSNKLKLYQLIANLVSIKNNLLDSELFMADDEEEMIDLLGDVLDILLNYTVSVSD